MTSKRLVTTIVVTIFLIGATGILLFFPMQKKQNVSNFMECMQAGNPVLEIYPRQCKAPDGSLFTEEIPSPTPLDNKGIDFTPIEYSTPSAEFSIDTQRTIVVNSPQDWYGTISEEVEPPLIDFAKYTLLGIFGGEQLTGGYFVKIESIEENESEIVVTASIDGPGEGCAAVQAITYPYSLLTIPKTKKDVVFDLSETITDCVENSSENMAE